MSLLDKLEKRFRRVGIPNITLYLVFGQGLFYVLAWTGKPEILRTIALISILVLRGEVWLLFTFVFTPQMVHPIFLFFALYLFYMMGTSLESY